MCQDTLKVRESKERKDNSQGAMQETPVFFLGQEDPLQKGQATHSSILGLPLWLSLKTEF